MDPSPVRVGPIPLSDRIDTTWELSNVLKDATRSGQRHLMRRALDILQCDILRPSLPLTEPQLVVVMMALTELQHEAVRAPPDIALFCGHDTLVIDPSACDTLGLAAGRRSQREC